MPTFTEEISVYAYTKTSDGYGGLVDSYQSLTYAPIWANIEQTRSADIQLGLRPTEEKLFDVTVPYNFNGFTWALNYYIDTRFGLMKVVNIDETRRKREIVLTCALNEGTEVS